MRNVPTGSKEVVGEEGRKEGREGRKREGGRQGGREGVQEILLKCDQ